MEVVGEIFKHFFGLLWEMISGMLSMVPKAISLFLWILAAMLVLPCVFVANAVYPKWVEWGEDF
jgi:hypothetical protein